MTAINQPPGGERPDSPFPQDRGRSFRPEEPVEGADLDNEEDEDGDEEDKQDNPPMPRPGEPPQRRPGEGDDENVIDRPGEDDGADDVGRRPLR